MFWCFKLCTSYEIECLFILSFQSPDSSDEESLHIDTEAKTEVKGRNSKVSKNKGGSSAGILDLLQASKQVGGIDYSNNRYTYDCFPYAYERLGLA